MADISKATPRPWFVHDFTGAVMPQHEPSPGDVTVSCDHPASITVATMGRSLTATLDEARANAALIVKTVNERGELLSILRGCIDAFEAIGNMPVAYSRAVAMLAKADSDAR